MNSRDKILAAVAQNQPDNAPLPDISLFESDGSGLLEKFTSVLTGIGGQVFQVSDLSAIDQIITDTFGTRARVVNLVPNVIIKYAEEVLSGTNVHDLNNVDLAILKAHFGVAENGAVWITEVLMGERALPFISQHLAVVIHENNIVATMHQAYNKLSGMDYGYGSFIAGPSKTADIEQSLVIGAHGPRSMSVFVLLN
jgi:L-lactate dehydrogenase complex protein LldG